MTSPDSPRILRLSPADYRRSPWKNGGGVTIDIAAEWRAGGAGWSGLVWRLGRTSIITPGPFSDLSGFDRAQVIVGGRGLSLTTPGGDLDLRAPLSVARFSGETPIVSRLDDGAVDVVNLLGARDAVTIDMIALRDGETMDVAADVCLLYAPTRPATITLLGKDIALGADHAARIDKAKGLLACATGPVLVASINRRDQSPTSS
ncbi:MAG: hypothetical protein BGP06_15520 [Rhizobiales bacterium 65-9]|nr:MAG: hypothetical protein BGP06_15520 [Rhizobiales bacterium 65-9]